MKLNYHPKDTLTDLEYAVYRAAEALVFLTTAQLRRMAQQPHPNEREVHAFHELINLCVDLIQYSSQESEAHERWVRDQEVAFIMNGPPCLPCPPPRDIAQP